MMSNYPAHWSGIDFQTLKQTGIAVNIFEHRKTNRWKNQTMLNHSYGELKNTQQLLTLKESSWVCLGLSKRDEWIISQTKLCDFPLTKRQSGENKQKNPDPRIKIKMSVYYMVQVHDKFPLMTMSDVSVPDPKSKFVSLNVKHLR